MIKGLQYAMLISAVVSVSLFDGMKVGLTKEIDNMREGIVCAIEYNDGDTELSEEEQSDAIGYTEGFWVDEDERVYLLTPAKKQVLEVIGGKIRKIELFATILPADMITDDDNIYIFDDILSEVQIYTKQGELLLQSNIALTDDYVKQFLKTDTGVVISTYHNKWITINPKTGEQTVTEGESVPDVKLEEYDFSEYIATEANGTVYSVHTKLVENSAIVSGELILKAVSADGICIGSYRLPVEEYEYLPRHYIQVRKNGNVYFLVPTENGVEIRKIALKESTQSKLQELAENAEQTDRNYAANSTYRKRIGASCKEKVYVTRERALERAVEIAEYSWVLKATHTWLPKAESNVTLPKEVETYRKQNEGNSSWSVEMKGIPYCWGGFYAVDGGVGGKSFQNVLNRGYIAGNVNTEGYYKYMTAGLDCSGFASAVLGLNEKQSTKGLSDVGTKRTDIREMEQMDYFVYPGEHVLFFCDWIDDTTMLVAESAVREGRAEIHPKSINELVVNGKYQMRSPW